MLELLEAERSSLDGECCICKDGPATCALVPCGHWCVCDACGGSWRDWCVTCPLCRRQVDGVMKIFRSASSRTEMAAEDHARSSGAVPEDDFPAEDPFELDILGAIEVAMREDEALPEQLM